MVVIPVYKYIKFHGLVHKISALYMLYYIYVYLRNEKVITGHGYKVISDKQCIIYYLLYINRILILYTERRQEEITSWDDLIRY